jgi:hypothetical protein
MKVLAAVLLLAASPAFAADCFLAPADAAVAAMSVVAPEMQRATPPDPSCVSAADALARIRAMAALAAASAPGAYVPLTKDDNSPWRFDMSQNGRRMTAEEFDAWMKAKGIRVAKGRQDVPVAPPPPPPGG